MSKFIKATVNRPIGGYGYFKGDEGSFPEDQVNNLANKGYITVTEKPEPSDKAKEEAAKKAKDEADKKAAEQKAKEDAEKQAEADNKAKEEAAKKANK